MFTISAIGKRFKTKNVTVRNSEPDCETEELPVPLTKCASNPFPLTRRNLSERHFLKRAAPIRNSPSVLKRWNVSKSNRFVSLPCDYADTSTKLQQSHLTSIRSNLPIRSEDTVELCSTDLSPSEQTFAEHKPIKAGRLVSEGRKLLGIRAGEELKNFEFVPYAPQSCWKSNLIPQSSQKLPANHSRRAIRLEMESYFDNLVSQPTTFQRRRVAVANLLSPLNQHYARGLQRLSTADKSMFTPDKTLLTMTRDLRSSKPLCMDGGGDRERMRPQVKNFVITEKKVGLKMSNESSSISSNKRSSLVKKWEHLLSQGPEKRKELTIKPQFKLRDNVLSSFEKISKIRFEIPKN